MFDYGNGTDKNNGAVKYDLTAMKRIDSLLFFPYFFRWIKMY